VVPCSRTARYVQLVYIGAERSDMQRCKPVIGCRPKEARRLATYNQLTFAITLLAFRNYEKCTGPRILLEGSLCIETCRPKLSVKARLFKYFINLKHIRINIT
jgi:hypothetical protein